MFTTRFSMIKKSLITVPLALASHSLLANPVINEFVFNHTGTDAHEYIEIFGDANTNYTDYAILEIEGDSSGAGRIDGVFPVGTTNSQGLWTTNFQFNNLENGSVTLLLVRGFSGNAGQDLDTNNDGTLDTQPWAEIVDAVAVSDNGASDQTYANVILNRGYDGVSFTVGGASRIPNGTDTDQASDWQRNDFDFADNADANALNTPNTINTNQADPIAATIMQIQGAKHLSALNGQLINTQGIITAVAFNGFYLQNPQGDNNDHTSDGIFVFTNDSNSATIGDEVAVIGVVNESVPGGAATGNLSITQLFRPQVATLSSDNPLPAASVIGQSGRVPPNEQTITPGEVGTGINLYDPADAAANRFSPRKDGIDFYESLEGMLVRVESPAAVSPLRTFSFFSSEVFTVANYGADIAPADALNVRGGIELQPHPLNLGDQNPERVQIQFDRTLYGQPPLITVGDKLTDVIGVVGYSFGNYEVNATEAVSVIPGNLEPETTTLAGSSTAVSVASYNVLNLSAISADDAQRTNVANQIANNLNAPDIVALQEIQDNNGETNDGTVDATQTLQALVDAIAAAGGPAYSFFTVNPIDGAEGGIPGGNIRNAYLYNTNRVQLVDFVALNPTELGNAGVNPAAFAGTRTPLLANFDFNGEMVTVINNHLSSRFGSTPVYGAIQPFVQAGETERENQVTALNAYVDYLLAGNSDKNIIVLGDLNTFQWTDDLRYTLPGLVRGGNEKQVLFNLVDKLPEDEAYTFIFDGNSQVLDHIYVSRSLKNKAQFDIVHVNNDFPRIDTSTASDHEPILAVFDFRPKKDKDNNGDKDGNGDGGNDNNQL